MVLSRVQVMMCTRPSRERESTSRCSRVWIHSLQHREVLRGSWVGSSQDGVQVFNRNSRKPLSLESVDLQICSIFAARPKQENDGSFYAIRVRDIYPLGTEDYRRFITQQTSIITLGFDH